MAHSYLKTTFVVALLLSFMPTFTLALPTDSTIVARNNPEIVPVVERTHAVTSVGTRNKTDLVARQGQVNDASGQIQCTPTWNLHDCQLRSTQFQDFGTVLTVFDPLCNAIGIKDDEVVDSK